MMNLDNILKSRDITFLIEIHKSQRYFFFSSCAQMWKLNHKCLSAEELMLSICSVGEKSPLNSKGIKPINPKGNQPWTFSGRTDAEAEAPVLGPLNANSLLTGQDPDTGKDCRQRRRSQIVRWLDSITDSMHMNLRKLQEIVKDRGTWHAAVHGVVKNQTWLCDWTTRDFWTDISCVEDTYDKQLKSRIRDIPGEYYMDQCKII